MSRLELLFTAVFWCPCVLLAGEPAPGGESGKPAPEAKPGNADVPAAAKVDPERVKVLLEKLGHEDFEEREKATVELIDMGPGIKADVERIEKETKDPEVTQRCAKIRAALADLDQTALGVLRFIEKSGATFLRPGGRRNSFDGPKFSVHLQGKALLAGFSLTGTAKEFIEKIASTSSLHGTAYRVLLPDGTELDVKEWLGKRYRSE